MPFRLAFHGKIHGRQYLPRKVYQARRREAAKGGMELFEGGEGKNIFFAEILVNQMKTIIFTKVKPIVLFL